MLCGILFVLYTGIPWRFLPQELGFGSGMTCWRRLRDWNDAGVWQRLHELLADPRALGCAIICWRRLKGSLATYTEEPTHTQGTRR